VVPARPDRAEHAAHMAGDGVRRSSSEAPFEALRYFTLDDITKPTT
jgi:hypothetical protein